MERIQDPCHPRLRRASGGKTPLGYLLLHSTFTARSRRVLGLWRLHGYGARGQPNRTLTPPHARNLGAQGSHEVACFPCMLLTMQAKKHAHAAQKHAAPWSCCGTFDPTRRDVHLADPDPSDVGRLSLMGKLLCVWNLVVYRVFSNHDPKPFWYPNDKADALKPAPQNQSR